jgi:hypothetical protein
MPIVSQNNGLLAKFAVFPVEPERQTHLSECVIRSIDSILKQHSGFAAGSVLRSRDGSRVLTNFKLSPKKL